MITVNKSIEILDNNIFRNDLLNRKEIIKDLSRLISADTQPFVLSVNADWGAGKTTFIKLWKAYLAKECAVKSVYFSAWESDFTSDPLIAILGELNTYIEENNDDKLKSDFEKVKKIGEKIIRNTLPAILKEMAVKLVGNEAVAQVAGNLAENSAATLIDNYQKEKTSLKEFKDAIAKILEKINKDKPFIIFIDELDRCRPLYAIECLERIKHIFGIKRLVFVLSIDKRNLAKSIQSQYGNIDADNYLRRFIDLEFNLKNPGIDNFCNVLSRKFELDNILENKKISTNEINKSYGYLFAIKTLAKGFNLSLRQIEQIFTKLQIVFKTTEPRIFAEHFSILALFESLKSYDNNLYLDLTNGEVKAKDKIKMLIAGIKNDRSRGGELRIFKRYAHIIIDATALSNDELKSLIKQKNDELSLITNKNSPEYRELYYHIGILQQSIGDWGDYGFNQMVQTVIEKIDFADKFNLD
jgi:predicted KAP-like P-loop ATPase